MSFSPAQAADEEVHRLVLVIPDHAHVTRTIDIRIESVHDDRVRSAQSQNIYDDDVTKTADGYAIHRHRIGTKLSPPQNTNYSSPEWVVWWSAVDDMTYTTDSDFISRDIEDWPEVQRHLFGSVDSAIAKSDPTARGQLARLDAGDAASVLLEGENMMSSARRYMLRVGYPLKGTTTSAAPGGGGTLSLTKTFSLTKWDTASDDAEIDYDLGDDSGSLNALMNRTLAQMNQSHTKLSASWGNDLEMSQHCHFSAWISSGLIRHGECIEKTVWHHEGHLTSETKTIAMSENLNK